MSNHKLKEDLIRDEGMRLKPYVDTVGKVTIGVGRNLTDNGILLKEAYAMLNNDVAVCNIECRDAFAFWNELSETQQRGLANMVFNMGMPRVLKFKKMLAALETGNYDLASKEALESKWAMQVGERAVRIADLLRG